jgi:hypothetical protein
VANRRRVEAARRATGARLLCHGHYHQRYHASMEDPATLVEGLAADLQSDGQAWGVLELPSLGFTDGTDAVATRMRDASRRRGPS